MLKITELESIFILKTGELSEREIQITKESIKYLITGALILYNNRGYPANYVNFQESMNIQIDNILSNKK